jgi:hypothetical protein
MANEVLHFNGINGATGEYLLAPQPPELISKIAQGEALDQSAVRELKFWYQRVTQQGAIEHTLLKNPTLPQIQSALCQIGETGGGNLLYGDSRHFARNHAALACLSATSDGRTDYGRKETYTSSPVAWTTVYKGMHVT